ncbi:unnamed protein product [Vitrella brassicaformis CCMP3155]|uniref:Dynein attachment factor N-terminal domain-containing protein n=2 Tax=Vitrella brassicaformis TaxID=1169539 RepID=A0A0G4GDM4_VITBC|nr:unnamed protein product [Vitrella brassicaformis CCMP3155]|eukprot:CEM27508.1 unnamed protein product [Vitrella brassicaformis CCMP3155]
MERVKKEVRAAVGRDENHQRTDNMKKRAIYQARSYDEFKNFVATAHLNPLGPDAINAPPKFAFNRCHNDATAARGESGDASARGAALTTASAGRERGSASASTIDTDWRRMRGDQEKLKYILGIPTSTFAAAMGARIDSQFLTDLLFVFLGRLEQQERPGDDDGGSTAKAIAEYVRVIGGMSSVRRLKGFFTSSEREKIARLLELCRAADGGGQGEEGSEASGLADL